MARSSLDEKSQIVLANPTARRLFRWEGRNLEGQDFLNSIPDLLAIELHEPLDGVLNQGRDSNELRSSIGEPPRTLRFVLQAGTRTQRGELKGNRGDHAGSHA
jgi:two-component system sensor histidine kinase NblS